MKKQLTPKQDFKIRYAAERVNFKKYMELNIGKSRALAALEWLYLEGEDEKDPARYAVYSMAKQKYLGNRYQWTNTTSGGRFSNIRYQFLTKGIL